ncbi:MAG: hypothetical protein U9N85_01915 [Bacteroidota bacterium]|nr:hypothetical protein [Bacteroidota bacterium]
MEKYVPEIKRFFDLIIKYLESAERENKRVADNNSPQSLREKINFPVENWG